MDKRQNDHLAITIDYDDDLLINVDTASFVEWWVFFFNEYEGSNITNVIKRIVRPGAVVFDIGANIGVYTLVMSRQVGDYGRVYAFEPQHQEFNKLRENVSLNRLANVRLMACALSDQPGTATLYSHSGEVANRAASSLRLERVSGNAISQAVELSTIDQIIQTEKVERLDFLKIDTEGHDFRVLQGAQASISRFRPHVIFEYHEPFWQQEGFDFSDAEQFFNELDYSLYVFREGHLTPVKYGRPHMHDILAVPRLMS
jgi:FkbM family methyltransferase